MMFWNLAMKDTPIILMIQNSVTMTTATTFTFKNGKIAFIYVPMDRPNMPHANILSVNAIPYMPPQRSPRMVDTKV